ncbi:hypothetical protein PMAYCL1PPCAC_28680, partial [Pristionchus mayeri]
TDSTSLEISHISLILNGDVFVDPPAVVKYKHKLGGIRERRTIWAGTKKECNKFMLEYNGGTNNASTSAGLVGSNESSGDGQIDPPSRYSRNGTNTSLRREAAKYYGEPWWKAIEALAYTCTHCQSQ